MEKIYAIITMYKPNIIKFVEKENIGLGAINFGFYIAKAEKADYILLLDQDSTPEENMVETMLDVYKRKTFSEQVAAIGPTMINKRTGDIFKAKFKYGKDINEYLAEVDQLPTSGMLIPIKVIDKVGRFCEDLFLDLTDFEWCWRAKKEGYKILRHKKAFLKHELGIDTKRLWFIEYNVPTPQRQYYLFRNSIFAIMCNYAPVYMRFRYFSLIPLKFLIYTLFLNAKTKRLKYTVLGLKDGLKKWVFGNNPCILQR